MSTLMEFGVPRPLPLNAGATLSQELNKYRGSHPANFFQPEFPSFVSTVYLALQSHSLSVQFSLQTIRKRSGEQ
jgi:hypothetical protein